MVILSWNDYVYSKEISPSAQRALPCRTSRTAYPLGNGAIISELGAKNKKAARRLLF
jgi:hypothetical protein